VLVPEKRFVPPVEKEENPVCCGFSDGDRLSGEELVLGKLKLGILPCGCAPVFVVLLALPLFAGGSDSTREAPNDEVGLKALSPAKPVA